MKVKDEFSANTVEGYKAPRHIRYVLLIKTMNDRKPQTVMTLRSLQKLVAEKNIQYIKVIDLREDTIRELILSMVFSFMEDWRENYFYEDWYIPYQYFY